MKTIHKHKIGNQCFGILTTENWFSNFLLLVKGLKIAFLKQPDNFVVATWHEYNTASDQPAVEAKQTIAVCRDEKHALLIYNNLITNEN